jgi:FG-GAP-like repeat
MRAFWAGLLICAGLPLAAQTITSARYAEPTDRYDHGILGDDLEWGALVLTFRNGSKTTLRLPDTRVFEDIEPRIADVDGDGSPEVIVIETDMSRGASLAIYDAKGKRTATPYIGRSHRWLAPLGAADLDGDGIVEVAYIDRPHLAKTLRIWRYQNDKLVPVAELAGLTNHQIGQDFILGGIRDCGQGPEIITVNTNWSRLMASTLLNGALSARDIGAYKAPSSFEAALNCAH